MDVRKLHLHCIFFLICTGHFVLSSRKLSYELNPGCEKVPQCNPKNYDDKENFPNLAYVRSDSGNETIHYLWSTIDSFSVLIAKTSADSHLNVSWESLLNVTSTDKVITFSKQPIYFVSFVITKILEFNDIGDSANLKSINDSDITIHYPTNLKWQIAQSDHNSSTDEISITFITSHQSPSLNGTFSIKTSVYAKEDRSDTNPRLVHTPEAVQMEFFLDQIKQMYDDSRFALEISTVSSSETGKYDKEETSTMDDEYTPGVFTTYQVKAPENKAYAQWKPIIYTSSARTVEAITTTRLYSLQDIKSPSSELNGSLPFNFKGTDLDHLVNSQFNVSFGQPKDNFYASSKYQIWTVIMGLGTPPTESPSLTIILTLIIGLGIPVVLMIAGSIYLLYVRYIKQRRGDEMPINSSIQ